MSFTLELRGVSASYGHIQVLDGIDLAVRSGGITTLLGPNGAGKTSTLRAICNTQVRVSGDILFEGQAMTGRPTSEIVRLGIAHVPDGRGTFAGLSVEENLRVGAYTRKDKRAVGQDFERVYHYFPKLKERLHQQAGTLSGGEQQMLAISRALMLRPKLLLLDEPSFGLAPLIVREIFDILRLINQRERVSILLIEQNANLALQLADWASLLEMGRIVAVGDSKDFQQNEKIRAAYLGN